MIFDIVIFIMLILFGRAIFTGIKSGIFLSAYGEAMTVRKSEGAVGYYAILILYLITWTWMAYLLIN